MIYNVIILGCGRVAYHHAEAIQSNESFRLVGVCDLNIPKVKEFSKKYDVPYFDNYFAMLNSIKNIDIAVIATPSGMHFEHSCDFIKNRINVIVEKPTFMNPGQLQKAYRIAKEYQVKIFPVFQNRFNKAVDRVKEGIKNNELGKLNIISVRLRWCRPQRYYDLAEWRGTLSHDGGASANQGIHHIDLMRYLGGEVESVNALMKTYEVDIDSEDSMVAIVKFTSGAIGNIEITTAARPDDFEASISLVGSSGLAQIGGKAVNKLQIFTPCPKDCAKNSEDFDSIKNHGALYGFGHSKIYQEIYKNLYLDKEFYVSMDDACKTIALLNSLYESNLNSGWVKIDDTSDDYVLGRENEIVSNLYRTKKISL